VTWDVPANEKGEKNCSEGIDAEASVKMASYENGTSKHVAAPAPLPN
jgi:hypothetical protein